MCIYYFSPLLHVLLSLPNINPALQEHTCHSFLLLHIWLHPPLFALSQGCTKRGNTISDNIICDNLPTSGIWIQKRLGHITNLSYKSFCLPVIQIQVGKSIHDFPLSYYKFDYNHRCLIHRMDVLNVEMISFNIQSIH